MSLIETIDAFRYKELFERATIQYKDFKSFVDVFNPDLTGQVDFARPLINYFLTSFTNNYHVLFGFYGIIFGYFYSRNIDFILKQTQPTMSGGLMGIILFAACYIGFWQINGFRFWTASHIFVYGLINYIYLRKRKKGIIFLILPLTVHFSFIIPLLIFVFSKFVPSLKKSYLLVTLVFLIYNPLSDLAIVNSYLLQYSYNEQLERKVEAYTSENAVERSQESSYKTNIFKSVINFCSNFLILLLTFLVLINEKLLTEKDNLFIKFGILLSLVGSILSFVPSMGRFFYVGMFLILIGLIVVLLNNSSLYIKRRNAISKLGYLATIFIFLTNIWIIFTFSFHTLLGNYFTVLIDDSDILYSVGNFLQDIYRAEFN
jgi:hypothetical protein